VAAPGVPHLGRASGERVGEPSGRCMRQERGCLCPDVYNKAKLLSQIGLTILNDSLQPRLALKDVPRTETGGAEEAAQLCRHGVPQWTGSSGPRERGPPVDLPTDIPHLPSSAPHLRLTPRALALPVHVKRGRLQVNSVFFLVLCADLSLSPPPPVLCPASMLIAASSSLPHCRC